MPGTLDRLLGSTVPISVTMSQDTAGHGRHRAGNNCPVGGNGSDTQIKPFFVYESRRELDGGALG